MKVAIAGYAAEGKVNYRYWRERGHQVTIVDERELSPHDLPYGASAMLGEGVLKELGDFDLVVRTASLDPKKIKTKGKIWSATNEFFDQCPAEIIGVTGTKGKGTTCSLIASIFEAAGKTVHLVGNIGTPALEVLPDIKADDIVVFELSSFQLWDIEMSPHIAVVLMIERDHLDIHHDMKDYIEAKTNIVLRQGKEDTAIYHAGDELSRGIAVQSKGIKIPYTERPGVRINDGFFWYDEQKVCSTSSLLLPGKHNLDNAAAAITAVWPYVQDGEVIAKGLSNFAGLPHRLKYVSEVAGVKYYDDSIATTPGSAIAALHSFTGPKVIILGGSDKGVDYTQLVEECRELAVQVVAIGQTGELIAELCEKQGVKVVRLTSSNMQEIVGRAHDMADGKGVVILSPASASFDMFKNYSERGDKFIAAVKSLEVG